MASTLHFPLAYNLGTSIMQVQGLVAVGQVTFHLVLLRTRLVLLHIPSTRSSGLSTQRSAPVSVLTVSVLTGSSKSSLDIRLAPITPIV